MSPIRHLSKIAGRGADSNDNRDERYSGIIGPNPYVETADRGVYGVAYVEYRGLGGYDPIH